MARPCGLSRDAITGHSSHSESSRALWTPQLIHQYVPQRSKDAAVEESPVTAPSLTHLCEASLGERVVSAIVLAIRISSSATPARLLDLRAFHMRLRA